MVDSKIVDIAIIICMWCEALNTCVHEKVKADLSFINNKQGTGRGLANG